MLRLYKNIGIFYTALLMLLTCSSRPLPAIAGESTIVVLMSKEIAPYGQVLTGFRTALERQEVWAKLSLYSLQDDTRQADAILQAVEEERADLVFTLGSPATRLVVQSALEVPILAGMVFNKEELTRTANATGVLLDFPIETQFQWLKHVLPDYKTIGVIFNPEENQDTINAAAHIAERMGFSLVAQAVQTPQDLPNALDHLSRRADVLWGVADKTVISPQTAKPLLLFSFRNRIPFIGLSTSWVKAGALYALDRDYMDVGVQCAEMAGRILTGTRAADIPPTSPRTVTYALNLKTARHLKLEMAAPVVRGAQQIFR